MRLLHCKNAREVKLINCRNFVIAGVLVREDKKHYTHTIKSKQPRQNKTESEFSVWSLQYNFTESHLSPFIENRYYNFPVVVLLYDDSIR